ncbi:hypothetical protein DXG01_008200, partial [Tephrocybe rancida]
MIDNMGLQGHIGCIPHEGELKNPTSIAVVLPCYDEYSTDEEAEAFRQFWAADDVVSHILTVKLSDTILNSLPSKYYSDNTFRVALSKDVKYHKPYRCNLPTPQCHLLQFWDKLGIPQLYSPVLTIIGIEDDAQHFTPTLPKEAINNLLTEIDKFMRYHDHKSPKFPLKVWQQLA